MNKILPEKVRVLAVVSPKGGSGKTTTTANLAVALSSFNKYILAVDTNITTASLGIHFDIVHPPVTFKEVLDNNFSILKAMYFYNKYLQVIPSALSIELKDEPLAISEKIRKLTDHYDILLSDVVRRYDLILIDSAPGFSTEALAAMQTADALLLVTNPEFPSIAVTTKSVEYAKYLKRPIIGIVLNKVSGKSYELTKEEVEESLGVKVIAEIPDDPKVPESIAYRIPVVSYSPRSPASIAYKQLAAQLIGEEYEESKAGLWWRIKWFVKQIFSIE